MDRTFKPQSPVRNGETERFWDAAREGKLLIKQCDDCGEPFFYPRQHCPFCLSDSSWVEASGLGVVYSYTAVHQTDGYVLALVTLAEGPTIMTNIVSADPASIACGQQVRVEFIETTGEERLPVFVPV